nr:SUMF1/EgtB/PvdO family nonheme iron enzyme [uncultured Holophaga sp.]
MNNALRAASLLLLAGATLLAQEAEYPPPIGKRLNGGIVPHVERVEHPVDAKTLRQPPELAESIRRMQKGTLAQRIAALKEKTLRDLVHMKGGRFWMGDFGQWHSEEGLPYSSDTDNKPPFEVELDGFSIGKYKVTYAEFDVFTDATGKPRIASSGDDLDTEAHRPAFPAGVSWQQAKDYCAWLAKLTGLPFNLPTEAQWEYAARSGGQYIVFGTDNGCLDEGRNFPTYRQERVLHDGMFTGMYPVGMFPPTPMGLYDLAKNGFEWLEDWYGPYPAPPGVCRNPRGPATGTAKAVRGYSNAESHGAMTFDRRRLKPVNQPWVLVDKVMPPLYIGEGFRIAVDLPQQPVRP